VRTDAVKGRQSRPTPGRGSSSTDAVRTPVRSCRARLWYTIAVGWAAGLTALLVLLVAYLLTAYVLLPAFWGHYEHLPAIAPLPKTTVAPDGLPGDPLNVALIGAEADVRQALADSGWQPATPVTARSALAIAESVVLDRPDPDAPMSELLLFGRSQDLAFEKDVGGSARQRNHVRFWRTEIHGGDGRPVWVGAATFDRGVGFSHTTGQITHHIAPDIDTERDRLTTDLEAARWMTALFYVTGVGPTLNGRNGGGDRWFSDGELAVGVLAVGDANGTSPVPVLSVPIPVVVKNQFWAWLRPVLGSSSPARTGYSGRATTS
jgi:hypothetical protein